MRDCRSKLLVLLLMLTATLLILAGCGGKDDPPAESGTVTDEVKPTYTKDTVDYWSFSDLEDNLELYIDELTYPLECSTEGYYERGDGGAGRYIIYRSKPENEPTTFKFAQKLWAVYQAEAGAETLNIKVYGARGNGKADDTLALTRSLTTASANNMTMIMPEGNYRTSSTWTLSNVNIKSENAKVSFYGTTPSVPAVDMKENVNIYGKFNIWFVDASPNPGHGGRCGMQFGNYGTGYGASNCYVEHVEITGGHDNANAILMTGSSHDIEIGRVDVPNGRKFGRAVLLHWGNANDHFVLGGEWSVENGYGHGNNGVQGDDWDPTEHPHDIKIGTLSVSNFGLDSKVSEGVFHVAAGYNVEVGEILVDKCNGSVMCVTGGDCGFEYASEADKAIMQTGIKIGKIKATGVNNMGLYVVGYALMYRDKGTNTSIVIDEFDVEGTTKSSSGIVLHYCENLQINKATLSKFGENAMLVANANGNIKINELNVKGCKGPAIHSVEHTAFGKRSEKIEIGTLNLISTGLIGTAVVKVHRVGELIIGSVTTDNVIAGAMIELISNRNATNPENSYDRIRIDKLDATGVVTQGTTVTFDCVVKATATVSADSEISIGELKTADGVPLQTGNDCTVKVGA